MELYTIGYEGFDVEDFVHFLKKNKIQLVADLRKNPLSRKKGFSKNKLADQLKTKKIDYIHMRNLGTPTEWRRQSAAGKMSRQEMFEMYLGKIIPLAAADIKHLRQLMRAQRTVILCYEADPTDCHRSFVAKEVFRLEKKKVKIINLQRKPKL